MPVAAGEYVSTEESGEFGGELKGKIEMKAGEGLGEDLGNDGEKLGADDWQKSGRRTGRRLGSNMHNIRASSRLKTGWRVENKWWQVRIEVVTKQAFEHKANTSTP